MPKGNQRDDDSTALDKLFADDGAERPDAVNLDAVTAMDTDEFVHRLNALADAAERIDELAEDAEALRETGLRESDSRDLIYGRNSGIRKSDIDTVFDALDDVSHGRGDLFVRLVADVSGLGIRDTRDILDELQLLRDRYGDE